MDQISLLPAALIIAFVVFSISGTLVGLYLRSRMRAGGGSLWLAGVYGAWTGLEDSAAWDRERALTSLRSWYKVENANDLDSLLEDLVRGQTGNLAWDAGRGADTVRIGLAAGLLSASECHDWTVRIAEVLQSRYVSWEQYLTAFEAGMHAWQDRSGVQDPEARGRVQRNYPLLAQQVWPKAPFKTPFE
jgi:hypothetical protein